MLYHLSKPSDLLGLIPDELSIIPTESHIIAVECDKISKFLEAKDPSDGPYLLFLDDALPLLLFFRATQDDMNAICKIRISAGLTAPAYLTGLPLSFDGRLILTPSSNEQAQ